MNTQRPMPLPIALLAGLFLLLGGLGSIPANAGPLVYDALHVFGALDPQLHNADGAYPGGALMSGGDGYLYGAVPAGGPNGCGTLFKMRPNGSGFQILHAFSAWSGTILRTNPDGIGPQNPLTLGSDGALYGTTFNGGANGTGTLFKIARDGSGFQMLHDFEAIPSGLSVYASGGLIENGGVFYGAMGGGAHNTGAIYRIHADGSGFGLLYSFSALSGTHNADGSVAAGPLLLRSGFLFGSAGLGGQGAGGTLFRLRTNGSDFTVLHTFSQQNGAGHNSDGAIPHGLTPGPSGYLYGAAQEGGPNGHGTLYRILPGGSGFQVLHAFSAFGGGGQNSGGVHPFGGLTRGNDDALYGTAIGGGANKGGTLFKINADGSGYEVLHDFSAPGGSPASMGSSPNGALLLGADGDLYGVTQKGGPGDSGVLFRLGPAQPPLIFKNPFPYKEPTGL